MDRRLFIDEQASLDVSYGCLSEGHTWEALRAAIRRAEATFCLVPGLPLPQAKHGGLRFV